MEDDLTRKVKELLEDAKRRLGIQDAGDDPVSSVPAALKPKPSHDSGAVALPEPEENAFSDPPATSSVSKPVGKKSTAWKV